MPATAGGCNLRPFEGWSRNLRQEKPDVATSGGARAERQGRSVRQSGEMNRENVIRPEVRGPSSGPRF